MAQVHTATQRSRLLPAFKPGGPSLPFEEFNYFINCLGWDKQRFAINLPQYPERTFREWMALYDHLVPTESVYDADRDRVLHFTSMKKVVPIKED